MQIGILEPDGFSSLARERLGEFGRVSDYAGGPLEAFVADKDVLFVRLGHRIDAGLLEAAPRLQAVCSPTTGHNHIDVEDLAKRDISLLSLKGETEFLETIRATPEHTLGLILALLRHYRTAVLTEDNDHWDRDRCRGEELSGATVGIIGFGRIGQRVASYLRAFDAKIGFCDPEVANVPPDTRRFLSVPELIAASKIVVLAAAFVAGRPPIIDRACIEGLKGRYFINIARGELVDEEVLLDAVEAGRLAGCAVDVIRDETGIGNNRARWIAATAHPNVIVTPHIGGATFTSMRATEEFIADKAVKLFANDGAVARKGSR